MSTKTMRTLAISHLCVVTLWFLGILPTLIFWPFLIFEIPLALAGTALAVTTSIIILTKPRGPKPASQVQDGMWYPTAPVRPQYPLVNNRPIEGV